MSAVKRKVPLLDSTHPVTLLKSLWHIYCSVRWNTLTTRKCARGWSTAAHTNTHTHTQRAIILVTPWRQGSILENEGILHGDKSQQYWVLRRLWRLDSSWAAPILTEWWLRLGSSAFGSTSWLSLQVIPFNLLRIFSTQYMAPYVLKRNPLFWTRSAWIVCRSVCCTNLG